MTDNAAFVINWQTTLLFDGLNESTDYFIFARAKENDTYKSGVASASLAVKTDVAPLTPVVTSPATLAGGTAGVAYNQTLTATGATPITWERTAGALPTGLTLSTAGVISGTPTAAGTFTFTVIATNAAGDSEPKELSITIAKGAGATLTTPTLSAKTSSSITINAVSTQHGQAVEYGISATDNAAAATWQTGLVFTGLTAATDYYIFARVKGDDNYNVGAASPSLKATTDTATSSGELLANPLRAWVRD
jgi:hypothetical protein